MVKILTINPHTWWICLVKSALIACGPSPLQCTKDEIFVAVQSIFSLQSRVFKALEPNVVDTDGQTDGATTKVLTHKLTGDLTYCF